MAKNGGICIGYQMKRQQEVAFIVCIAEENGTTMYHGLVMIWRWVSCLGIALVWVIYR